MLKSKQAKKSIWSKFFRSRNKTYKNLLSKKTLTIFTASALLITTGIFAVNVFDISAATTGTLSSTADGFYTDWPTGNFSDIDEAGAVSCSSTDSIISSNTTGQRDSFIFDISSIPNGSTLESATVQTWDQEESGQDGTYARFIRIDVDGPGGSTAVNTDGSSVSATSGFCTDRGAGTVNFSDIIKASATIFEAGVLKTGGDASSMRIGAIRVVITYTPPPPKTITATAGAGGSISPSGAVSVAVGADQTFSSSPSAGNILSAISIDAGASVGRLNSYTFQDVIADHTIHATFEDGWTAPTGFLDGDGDVTDEVEAFTSNDLSTDMDQDNDDVDFTNFGLSIPAGATIDGIELAMEGSRADDRSLIVSLSWDNGTSFTSTKTLNFSGTETTFILGSPADTWGHTWTPAELSNANFRVRVITGSQNGDTNLDQLQVKVHYTEPSKIIVDKITVPAGDPTPFDFIAGGAGYTSFSLTHTQNPNEQTLAPGVYSISETAVPGWSTSVVCINGQGGNEILGDDGPVYELDLDPGETITCTFTNTKLASLTIQKSTIGENGTFDFTVAGPSASTPDVSTIGGFGSAIISLLPGDYTVTEDAEPGWIPAPNSPNAECVGTIEISAGSVHVCSFTNTKQPTITVNKVVDPAEDSGKFNLKIDTAVHATDVGNGGTTGPVVVSVGSHNVSEVAGAGTVLSDYVTTFGGACLADGSINLAPGQDASCTITNTKKGKIIVEKQTLPGGSAQSFEFDPSYAANFFLTDGQTSDSAMLTPGNYSVAEVNIPVGWDQTSALCNDDDNGGNPANITVDPGEIVTCVFTNTQRGHLVVQKTTHPALDPTVFPVTITGGASGTITDALDKDFEVIPGTYSATEDLTNLPTWMLVNNLCQDIIVGPGQTKYCQIINKKAAHVQVVKTSVGGIGQFDFTRNFGGGFSLTTLAPNTPVDSFFDVFVDLTGTDLSVTETVPPGWIVDSVICNLDGVLPGATPTCPFTNTKLGSITGMKFEDLDGNGQKDNGELPVAGLKMALGRVMGPPQPPENQIPIEIVALQLTGGGGQFQFDNVPPGPYKLFEEQRNGWVPTTPPDNFPIDSFFDITYQIDIPVPEQVPLADSFFDVFVDPGQPVGNGCVGTPNPIPLVCALQPLEFGNFELITVTVHKDVTRPDGSPVDDDHVFQVKLDGGSLQDFSETSMTQFTGVGPGGHMLMEAIDEDYVLFSPVPFTAISGVDQNITITNQQEPVKLKIIKVLPNNSGSQATPDQFGYKINGIGPIAFPPNGTSDVLVNPGTHSITEDPVTGFATSYTNDKNLNPDCNNLVLASNASATCTITNDDEPGTLIVKKVRVGSNEPFENFAFKVNGGDATAFDSLDGQNDLTVDAGTYDIVETPVPAGYDVTYSNCDDIVIANGGEVTCTITNTKHGHIIVDKVTDPSINPESFSFDTTGTGYAGFSLTDTDPVNNQELPAGIYSVTEAVPAEWDLTSIICNDDDQQINGSTANLVLDPGETITCTFTNTKRGHIIVEKNAAPDDAQDFTFSNNFGNNNLPSFDLDDDANATLPDARDFEVLPGIYSVTEAMPSGWKSGGVICDDQSPNTAIAVAPGETVTCTFTNKKLATLIVIKNTVGGDGEFDFTTTGGDGLPANFSIPTAGNTGSITFSNVIDPDLAFSIAESAEPGWEPINAVCSGTNTPANITPNNGEEITCTFTNGKLPTLILTKEVINDNGGGAAESDFQGKIDNQPVPWDATQTLPIGLHTASETNLTGYTPSAWDTDCAPDGSITLTYGDNKVCSITNDDDAAHLIVIKDVINDNGGDADAGDFIMTINSVTADGGNSFPGEETPGTDKILTSVGSYSVTESGPSGYDQSVSADCSGTIALGETKTCTITNNDQPGTLIVKKVVQNDNGGLSKVSNFQFSVNSGGAVSFEADGQNDLTVNAGTYTVTEPTVPGYSPSYDNCSNLVIPNGGSATCTITNSDVGGVISGMKFEDKNGNGVKDDGEPGLPGWTIELRKEGNVVDTEVSAADGSYSFFDIFVGEYTVTEVLQTGWMQTTPNPTQISISLGSIFDDIDFGNFHKVAISGLKWNDWDGDGVRDDGEPGLANWPIGLARVQPGNNPVPLEIIALQLTGGAGQYNFPDLGPGHYLVLESEQNGWVPTSPAIDSFFDITYVIQNPPPQPFVDSFFDIFVEVSGQNVTHGRAIGQGEPAPLEFGNFKRMSVTVQKDVLNPDEDPVDDPHEFEVTLDGGDQRTISEGNATTYLNLGPGAHTLDEVFIGDPDFDLLRITHDGNVLPGGEFVPQSGQDMTIVVVNTQKKAKIKVIKNVVAPDNSDVSDDHQFNVTVNGEVQLLSESSPSLFEVNPGTHGILESDDTGYTIVGYSPDDEVTLGSNDTATITITNKQKPGKIEIRKTTIGDIGTFTFVDDHGLGTKDITTDAPGVMKDSFFDIFDGLGEEFTITETLPEGWSNPDLECQVTVNPGDTVVCEFTNTKLGKILVFKQTDPDADLEVFAFTSDYDINGFNLADDNEANDSGYLIPATYSVAETPEAGWDLLSATCSDNSPASAIELGAGEIVICTFTNQKDSNIIVKKETLPEGDPQVFDFDLSYGSGDADLADGEQNDSGDLDPGTYNVSETVPAGWDLASAICSDGSLINEIKLEAGETVICTFTNVKRGHIIVQKNTNPAFAPTVFDITASGTGTITGSANGTISDAADYDYEVTPGTYSVNEVNLPPSWSMTGNTCQNRVVAPGQTVFCLITNTKLPTLTVNKVLIPAEDPGLFNLQIDSITAGTGTNVGDGGTTGALELFAGLYQVGETAGTGTSLSDYTSVIDGDCNPSGAVLLNSGENKICTITNTRKPQGTITFVKEVVGGQALGSEWTFDITGNAQDIASGGQAALSIGSYTITESGPVDYTLTGASGVCSLDQGVITLTVTTLGGTCTITNTFVPPLTIDDEQTATPTETSVTINWTTNHPATSRVVYDTVSVPVPGSAPNYGYSFSTVENPALVTSHSEVVSGLTPGVTYYFRPVSHGSPEVVGDELTIQTLPPQPGTLIVRKIVSGGPAAASQFSFTVNGQPAIGFEPDGQNEFLVPSGDYNVVEVPADNYTPLYDNCANTHVPSGGSATCTIINQYIAPQTGSLIVTKYTAGGDGTFSFASNELGAFDITTTAGIGSKTFQNIAPGNYSAAETLPPGWVKLIDTCQNVQVVAGQTAQCFVSNYAQSQNQGSAKIKGLKYEDKDGDGYKDWNESGLSGWTIYLDANDNGAFDPGEVSTVTGWGGTYSFSNLPAGTYVVREVLKPGWMQTHPGSGKHVVSVSGNQTASGKNFGNFKLGKISGQKYEDKNGNGKKNGNEGGLSGWTIRLTLPNGSVIETVTGDDGRYEFGNLGPGTHRVREVQKPGWQQKSKNPSDIPVKSRGNYSGNNFGNKKIVL